MDQHPARGHWGRGELPHAGVSLLGQVDRFTSLLQSMFLGKIHRRKLLAPVVDCLDSTRVLNQRVVAFPIAFRQLMKLHFNFDTFVDSLNHGLTLPPAGSSCFDHPLAHGKHFMILPLTKLPRKGHQSTSICAA
jgi:hypothetical protein